MFEKLNRSFGESSTLRVTNTHTANFDVSTKVQQNIRIRVSVQSWNLIGWLALEWAALFHRLGQWAALAWVTSGYYLPLGAAAMQVMKSNSRFAEVTFFSFPTAQKNAWCSKLKKFLMLPYNSLALNKVIFLLTVFSRRVLHLPWKALLRVLLCDSCSSVLFLLTFVHICVCVPVKSSLTSWAPCIEPNHTASKGIIGTYDWIHLI